MRRDLPKPGLFLFPSASERGYSLLELMIVIVLIGIIMAIALPAGRDFIVQSRLTAQTNTLITDILYARSEAGNRGLSVVLCPMADATSCSASNADWAINRYTFVDTNGNGGQDSGEGRLKTATPMPKGLTLTAQGFNDATRIRFNNTGGLLPLGSSGSFKLCAEGASSGRLVSVGINGRPTSNRVSCP